eukprot:203968-Amphidinium_carterae.1
MSQMSGFSFGKRVEETVPTTSSPPFVTIRDGHDGGADFMTSISSGAFEPELGGLADIDGAANEWEANFSPPLQSVWPGPNEGKVVNVGVMNTSAGKHGTLGGGNMTDVTD